MENRLAAERVIIANLLFMLLTFRFHTATAFGRTDPRTVLEKLDGARAILSGADDRRNREFYPTGSRATRRPDAPTRP